jgi:hypothetical protein
MRNPATSLGRLPRLLAFLPSAQRVYFFCGFGMPYSIDTLL